MKIAISLPDIVFQEAELLARRLGLSRSELYTNALKSYLRRHSRDRILSKLNELCTGEFSVADPVLTQIQLGVLPKDDW
jgi:metal-responsive CopG/Arc/MetJ family transcriptional regulator